MKILWVKVDFLHPTNRGGQIRTLEMLKRLHARHELHYVAFEPSGGTEWLDRRREYCSRFWPVPHRIPPLVSPGFAWQVLRGLADPRPVAVFRYASDRMRRVVAALRREQHYDAVVCDFVHPAANLDDLGNCILFHHNVETHIWKRRAGTATNPAARFYFTRQARKMAEYEGRICREMGRVIAVSEADASALEELFGLSGVATVPTGVDIEYFAKPQDAREPECDLVFSGAMDWLPNVDGAHWFRHEILPLIRRERPGTTVTLAGRQPLGWMRQWAEADPLVRITGTVPDIRPYLWSGRVFIVPLRVGSGTRLKIYEAMAAGLPVVSTTIGAEGLPVRHPDEIRLADPPDCFAAECLRLLNSGSERQTLARSGADYVRKHAGWDRAAKIFEDILAQPLRTLIPTRGCVDR